MTSDRGVKKTPSTRRLTEDSNNNNSHALRDQSVSNLSNPGYEQVHEDTFTVTTPPPAPLTVSALPPINGTGTLSSIPEMLAPEPPRNITTVKIDDDDVRPEIRHSGASTSSGFDPVRHDRFSMPTIRNPLLQNQGDVIFVNGVATLPPMESPPPYTEEAPATDDKAKRKKKKKKSKKHVLIDTQRNRVHTFKSTHSDGSEHPVYEEIPDQNTV